MGTAPRTRRPVVRLVHWKTEEAEPRLAALRVAGFRPRGEPLQPDFLRALRERPPAAVVVDLTRLPAQGRDVAVAIRQGASTRQVPIVFAGGDADKVARVRALLPDAAFTGWDGIGPALRRAIAAPPKSPVAPTSRLAGYAGTPLPRKLGIKPGAIVELVGAPADLEETLGELPEGVRLRRRPGGAPDLVLWFLQSRRALEAGIVRMAKRVGRDGMWIAWPKQASGVATDLTQLAVRRIGLDHGLVDYKICAIDTTWSALKFTRRRRA